PLPTRRSSDLDQLRAGWLRAHTLRGAVSALTIFDSPGQAPTGRKGHRMKVESPEARDRIRNRLRRIEGQVRGVQRMLDDGRDCQEIVQQLAAIRAAVQQAGLDVMRVYAAQCLSDPN